MGDPQRKLIDELCSLLDEATILSISSDYDLRKPKEFAAAREVLLAISKDVAAEEATGFNPSGYGGQDLTEPVATQGMEGDLKSNDGLTTTTETLSSHSRNDTSSSSPSQTSEWEVPGIIHVSALDDLTNQEKVGRLAAMFVSLKQIDIRMALQKAKGDANLAMDELLNLQLLEQTGQRPKGVDGFYISDDDASKSKKKGRKRKNRVSKSTTSRSGDTATGSENAPQGVVVNSDSITFISNHFTLPLDEATDIYQRNKCSLGAAIVATLDNYLALGLPPSNDPIRLRQIEEQQKRIPWIPFEYFSPIYEMTPSSRAAVDVIDALADYFEKPAYVRYDVSYSAVASDLGQVSDVPIQKDISSSSTKLRSPQQLRATPTTLQTVGASKAMLAASAKHSYASASSAHKKGRSDPLMRQAAAFYADRGRSEAANHRQVISMEAELLVDQQSTRDTIDLHGVSVQDGVDIAIDRVWSWWNALGENKVRKARESGLKIITGLGRHSSDGKSRLRINVCKALVADGWKIEVLTGAYLVTGRI